MTLNLYSFFHLNLAYSSIEEQSRPQVISKCYWPQLRLAKSGDYPLGIEISGYTLECIAEIDSSWVKEFSLLVNEGPCELIGSGYSQIIGPLVPPEVTRKNLQLGNSIYKELIGVVPSIALLNEQAFSSSMVNLYKEAGYKALIMEWNNPARDNPDWDQEWRYLPQKAKGVKDEVIDLIWNKSISFQKFQRYVHGEIEMSQLTDYLKSHNTSQSRAFPLYGNDVEIFDFRPGRYDTEASLNKEGEWKRINDLYKNLNEDPDLKFIKPSDVLKLKTSQKADNILNLSTASQPIPVKKQDKYNIIRWAVSGRNDFEINTRCWRLFKNFMKGSLKTDDDWKELCFLWSSDFRTHITISRWQRYLDRLKLAEKKWISSDNGDKTFEDFKKATKTDHSIKIKKSGQLLIIEGKNLRIELNCLRGLAIESFTDLNFSEHPIIGTLHHGSFDDIRWGADFYSGHLVFQSPGKPKITDLVQVEPEVLQIKDKVIIKGIIKSSIGSITKTWIVDDSNSTLKLILNLDLPHSTLGTLRVGYITLNSNSFDQQSLYYASNNGGLYKEKFDLKTDFDHGKPVSLLVSANQAVGATSGEIEIGDKDRGILVRFDQSSAALIGLVSHQNIKESHLTRLALSIRELDDTSKPSPIEDLNLEIEFSAIGKSGQYL